MTMEGREVFARASDLPDILADVEVASSQEVARGRVALTVNHDIAIARLLPALESFQQRYPRVQLDLVLSDDRLDLIAEQIDVAIRVGVPGMIPSLCGHCLRTVCRFCDP
ncbi:LysR substrate-binding domain-containing protein [Aliamphritea spongicola]|nr:LysR substrate-binding domain-containing protein [Aliamphritea spongicola]